MSHRCVVGMFALLCLASAGGAQVDLQIIDLPDAVRTGAVSGVEGYAVGFTVCNIGTAHAAWQSTTNQHPVEGWGIYRIRGGRIEQLGQSWLKHGNFAASSPGCGACDTTVNGSRLGVGCRDTYDANFNASQFASGPRSQVNAATGEFPYPPMGYGMTGNATYKRCPVADADLGLAGAVYLVEGVIVHPQDALAGNAANNASYRLASIAGAPGYGISLTGTTQVGRAAIQAWRDHGLGVNQPDNSVVLTPVDVAGDGRIWVGSKATDLGNGSWRYEYAIENLSSHRSVGGLVVPLAQSVAPLGVGFHDVAYHSGEPIDGTDWTMTATASGVRWATTPFEVNADSNAIRWGTMYSFRFEAAAAPTSGSVTLELFRPAGAADPLSVFGEAVVPSSPLPCVADFNGVNGTTVQDLFDFLAAYFGNDSRANVNGVGGVTVQDVFDYLGAYFVGC